MLGSESSSENPDAFDVAVDAATVRSLSLITVGQPLDFIDCEPPPSAMRRWLRKANLPQVRGLLIETLHRWHELCKQ